MLTVDDVSNFILLNNYNSLSGTGKFYSMKPPVLLHYSIEVLQLNAHSTVAQQKKKAPLPDNFCSTKYVGV